MKATTDTRQHIIDALVERGYGILEVTWVTDMPNLFSSSSSSGGMWAATFRNPLDGTIGYVTGRFLGQILNNIGRLPAPEDAQEQQP